MLPARLGWILSSSPCRWNVNALSHGHLRAGPGVSQTWTAWAFLWTPWACDLVSKRRGGKKVEGGEKTSFTNCSQLCPSSSHFSCQELQACALPNRLQSNRNPSQGEGLSIHPSTELCIGISIITLTHSPYQQEQPLCSLSLQRQHPHKGNG